MRSRFAGRSSLRGIYELLDLRSFFVHRGKMLCLELLINVELSLSAILLPGVNVILAKAVMRVGKVWVQLQRPFILRKRLGILMLIGIENTQLQVGQGKRPIQRYRLL